MEPSTEDKKKRVLKDLESQAAWENLFTQSTPAERQRLKALVENQAAATYSRTAWATNGLTGDPYLMMSSGKTMKESFVAKYGIEAICQLMATKSSNALSKTIKCWELDANETKRKVAYYRKIAQGVCSTRVTANIRKMVARAVRRGYSQSGDRDILVAMGYPMKAGDKDDRLVFAMRLGHKATHVQLAMCATTLRPNSTGIMEICSPLKAPQSRPRPTAALAEAKAMSENIQDRNIVTSSNQDSEKLRVLEGLGKWTSGWPPKHSSAADYQLPPIQPRHSELKQCKHEQDNLPPRLESITDFKKFDVPSGSLSAEWYVEFNPLDASKRSEWNPSAVWPRDGTKRPPWRGRGALEGYTLWPGFEHATKEAVQYGYWRPETGDNISNFRRLLRMQTISAANLLPKNFPHLVNLLRTKRTIKILEIYLFGNGLVDKCNVADSEAFKDAPVITFLEYIQTFRWIQRHRGQLTDDDFLPGDCWTPAEQLKPDVHHISEETFQTLRDAEGSLLCPIGTVRVACDLLQSPDVECVVQAAQNTEDKVKVVAAWAQCLDARVKPPPNIARLFRELDRATESGRNMRKWADSMFPPTVNRSFDPTTIKPSLVGMRQTVTDLQDRLTELEQCVKESAIDEVSARSNKLPGSGPSWLVVFVESGSDRFLRQNYS